MFELRADSLAQTQVIAGAVASVTRAGDVILLAGEMGAGKTAFAQGFGRALGIDEPITSPTFTLVHSYELPTPERGVRTLHHADLYRLDRFAEVADLALAELAEFGGIVLVEWGDVVESVFGDHLLVLLEHDEPATATEGTSGDLGVADGARRIRIAGVGPTWAARWDRLERILEMIG